MNSNGPFGTYCVWSFASSRGWYNAAFLSQYPTQTALYVVVFTKDHRTVNLKLYTYNQNRPLKSSKC